MEQSFKLDGRTYSVTVTGKPGASVRLNTLKLNKAGTIYSNYFIEHIVKLSSDAQNFDYWLVNGQKYDNPEVILSSNIADNGVIRAEVFLK